MRELLVQDKPTLAHPVRRRPHLLMFARRPSIAQTVSCLVAVLAAPVLAAAPGAVVPSQVVPRSVAPLPPAPSPAPRVDASRSSTSDEGNTLEVQVGDVEIEGGFADMQQAEGAFRQAVTHRHTTVGALFTAVHELEKAYARQGYILARVVLPQQAIDPMDALRVVVVDGFIEDVDLSAVPASVRGAVAARLVGLVGQTRLTEAAIERSLLLAGDLAGLRLRSALGAGQQVGASRLVVEAALARLQARVTIDNRLPHSLGRLEWNAEGVLNELWGVGDQIYASAGSQADVDRDGSGKPSLASVGGGMSLPLGADGASLGIDLIDSSTRPKHRADVVDTLGRYKRAEMRLNARLVRTRDQSLEATVLIDAVRQSLDAPAFATHLSLDRYVALRTNVDGQGVALGIPAAFDLRLSLGTKGRGADAALPLSRQGSSASFTHVDAGARFTLPVADAASLDTALRLQAAFGEPQMTSEQFTLAGDDAVSAAESGAFGVDDGATWRSELSPASPLQWGSLVLGPYVFGAKGWGRLAQPTALERRSTEANAWGVGARLHWGALQGANALAVELGHLSSNTAATARQWRANASLTASY